MRSLLTATLPILTEPPIIPLRSNAEKEFAQQCVRARQGAVYIKHHRKAGGTSVYQYLRQFVCPHMPVYGSERPFFNASSFTTLPNSTIFLTLFRHPIDRILSLYWFEGRWPRTCSSACENNKVKDNTTKVAELDEWIEAVYHQQKVIPYVLQRHTACGQWQSVENYYIRQLTAVDRGTTTSAFLNHTITRRDLQRAKQVLASFDLVLIQEFMRGPNKHPGMLKMLASITGGGIELPSSRLGRERAKNYHPPSDIVLQRLQELNKLDIELYEYAKSLSFETVQKWEKGEASRKMESDALPGCLKPRRRLSTEDALVLVSGHGCRKRPGFYFRSHQCIYHS